MVPKDERGVKKYIIEQMQAKKIYIYIYVYLTPSICLQIYMYIYIYLKLSICLQ